MTCKGLIFISAYVPTLQKKVEITSPTSQDKKPKSIDLVYLKISQD